MAIKCYFITPEKYKIPNLKNTKTGRGLRKKEGMQKYIISLNHPTFSKYIRHPFL